jgi:hypothetical protein
MSKRATLCLCAALCSLVGLASFSAGYSQGQESEKARLYELRIYTTHPGRLDALNARFRDHTMKLFEKHGMQNVAYFVPTDGEKKDNTLIYAISHASREAAAKSWKDFIADPEWHKARDASEKDGKIVAKVESTYMMPTDYSPHK